MGAGTGWNQGVEGVVCAQGTPSPSHGAGGGIGAGPGCGRPIRTAERTRVPEIMGFFDGLIGG